MGPPGSPDDVPVWSFYSIAHPVVALDVVWCHFPYVEFPSQPGPKPRPALVRSTARRSDGIYVEVAFGTSNHARYSDRDLYVANMRDMAAAGLPQATIFMLDRTVILPWAEEWFTKRADGTGPVVGHLSDQSQVYLRYLIRQNRPSG